MQTTTNNTEPTAVIIQSTGNPAPQQIFHLKTFKTLGGLQFGLGGILVILSLVELIGMSYFIEVTLPLFICCGWFVMTGCLPMCMSKNTQSSLKCKQTGFLVCSVIGAVVFVPIIFILSFLIGLFQSLDKSSNWNILSFSITSLSGAVGLVAIISASYCCCCSPLEAQKHQMVVAMNPSQPWMNLNAPGNQMQATNMLPLIDTTGKTILHPKDQQYNFVGGTVQGFGHPQNPNVCNSYPQIYINA